MENSIKYNGLIFYTLQHNSEFCGILQQPFLVEAFNHFKYYVSVMRGSIVIIESNMAQNNRLIRVQSTWFHLQVLAPNPDEISFDDWWEAATSKVDGLTKKGLNSIIILVAWSLWNHRNRCVFDGVLPNLNGVLSFIREEMHFWGFAGARGVNHILAQLPMA
jgi:hypothetical protein